MRIRTRSRTDPRATAPQMAVMGVVGMIGVAGLVGVIPDGGADGGMGVVLVREGR